MAHIVPLPHSLAQGAEHQNHGSNDPFDVVVFLEHFQNIDSFSDQLIAHFDTPTETQSQQVPASTHNLLIQLPEVQLAMSLGSSSPQ